VPDVLPGALGIFLQHHIRWIDPDVTDRVLGHDRGFGRSAPSAPPAAPREHQYAPTGLPITRAHRDTGAVTLHGADLIIAGAGKAATVVSFFDVVLHGGVDRHLLARHTSAFPLGPGES